MAGQSNTLARAVSEVLIGNKAKTPHAASPIMPRATSFGNLSVQDVVRANQRTNAWGIKGYEVPKNGGLLPSAPKYSVPKEKNKSFLQKVVKLSPQIPGSWTYYKEPSWKLPNGSMKGSNRKTFTDVIADTEGKKPGPGQYTDASKRKIPGGLTSRGDKVNFLCDAEYLSMTNPGPDKYVPNKNTVLPRSTGFKYILKDKTMKDWKVQKEKSGPDPGIYDPLKSFGKVITRSPSAVFSKSTPTTFSCVRAKVTGFVPGVGQYDLEKGRKTLYKPMKKR